MPVPSASILQAHPTGNPNVRALLAHWDREGLLSRFVTTIGFSAENDWLQWMPAFLRRQLERRRFPVAGDRMHRRPIRELVRHAGPRMGLDGLSGSEDGWASIDAVYRDLDRYVASLLPELCERLGLRHVYMYEDGAATSFARAEELGVIRHYDLPIGYWRAKKEILQREAEKNPTWGTTVPSLGDSEEKLARKDEELARADQIHVASSFTRTTLETAPIGDTPVSVIPYGAPPATGRERSYSRSGSLRALFVGGLTQRKGISYLFEAAGRLESEVDLTVVGRAGGNCRPLERALESHRWIPSLPHSEVLELMGTHDVLVFPTLFEGFGLVLTEALSRGTPVIATRSCAAPDLISDGEEGFLIPPASAEAIEEALLKLARDRELLVRMGRQAHEAAARLTWDSYAEGVTSVLEETRQSRTTARKRP